METLRTNISGKSNCVVFSCKEPEYILIQPMGVQESNSIYEEADIIADKSDRQFALTAFPVSDWDKELTPWPDAAVSKVPEVGKCAGKTLDYIIECLLPYAEKRFGQLPIIIGGYSLSALFSLWAAYVTDKFFAVAASSPSVWIKNWINFARTTNINARKVYLSLGDKEELTRNKDYAKVGDNIREYHDILSEKLGKENAVLEWNEGNHFRDGALRTAKGFIWAMK